MLAACILLTVLKYRLEGNEPSGYSQFYMERILTNHDTWKADITLGERKGITTNLLPSILTLITLVHNFSISVNIQVQS